MVKKEGRLDTAADLGGSGGGAGKSARLCSASARTKVAAPKGPSEASRTGPHRARRGFTPFDGASTRKGAAGWVWLVVFLVVGIAAIAWVWRMPETTTGPAPGARPTASSDAANPVRTADSGATSDVAFASPEDGASNTAEGPPPELSAADFRGRGVIRGTVVLPAGLELPETWELVVGPSRSLASRERAESRRVERPGTSRDFELTDLSLGGYDVWVEGAGLGSHRVPALLVRSSQHAFLNVAVHRSGSLDGFLLDEDGRPVEDVLVVLEDMVSGKRYSTHSTASGAYLLRDLPDSEYTIYFGGVSHPLVPAEALSFRAPSMRYPPRRMPALGTLIVRTIDPAFTPIGGATVHGYSPEGGLVETETDELGVARVRSLRPGRYTLAARIADPSREGRVSIEVHAGFENETFIALVARD